MTCMTCCLQSNISKCMLGPLQHGLVVETAPRRKSPGVFPTQSKSSPDENEAPLRAALFPLKDGNSPTCILSYFERNTRQYRLILINIDQYRSLFIEFTRNTATSSIFGFVWPWALRVRWSAPNFDHLTRDLDLRRWWPQYGQRSCLSYFLRRTTTRGKC